MVPYDANCAAEAKVIATDIGEKRWMEHWG